MDAIFAAVADAGVEWKDIRAATGGIWTMANPDAIVGMVGLSDIPVTNVYNACATAANIDGGLIANGEPIGASGLRQIHELVRQLRDEAGDRQVPAAPKVGFTQLYGAPGTAAATVLTL